MGKREIVNNFESAKKQAFDKMDRLRIAKEPPIMKGKAANRFAIDIHEFNAVLPNPSYNPDPTALEIHVAAANSGLEILDRKQAKCVHLSWNDEGKSAKIRVNRAKCVKEKQSLNLISHKMYGDNNQYLIAVFSYIGERFRGKIPKYKKVKINGSPINKIVMNYEIIDNKAASQILKNHTDITLIKTDNPYLIFIADYKTYTGAHGHNYLDVTADIVYE